MYLKSLEVQGFKSFANKIVFEFHNGITGIVGPNGSGKSNVADAVRWVLGEQSAKQLRGGNMQDVIFSGTENRKPLGFAYVAITLDNSDKKLPIDFEEVKVARRVYRSGESEYSINGTTSRLKDIHELFYDTGIGKEGYSIIGQGQIDKILSGKPEDRRELFDEAAGIVKFKRRKMTAQKKLENEKANLVRINDILSELTKQLEPLEKQSETAKVYLKKREQLKRNDVNMFLLEMAQIKEQLRELEKKMEIVSGDLEETTIQYDNAKVEYETIQQNLEDIEANVEKEKEKANQATLMSQQLEGQINVLREQIKTAKLSDAHLKSRLGIVDNELAEKEAQKQVFEKEKEEIELHLQDMQEVQRNIFSNFEDSREKTAVFKKKIEQAKSEVIHILKLRAATKAKIQRFDTMMEQISIRKSEQNKQLLKFKSDEAAQDGYIELNQNELEHINLIIHDLETEHKSLEAAIAGVNEKLMKMSKELEIGQTTFHRETSKLESLKNLTERYEGYGNSIRRIMKLKEKESGILGVVADMIKVDKEYEVAIETALGGSIQNIVTDNENTAKSAVSYLKKNKFGRATFLPLTSIGNRNAWGNNKVLQEAGVIGIASSLVMTDKNYAGIASFLLGRTIVVDTIDNGISLSKKYQYSLRIVTLEGESLTPGGSMTGGAFRNNSSLLGRRREIDELESNITMLKKSMADAQGNVEHTRSERVALRGKIADLKEQLNKQSLKQNTVKIKISQYQSKKEEIQLDCQKLHNENREIAKQLSDITAGKAEIDLELSNSIEEEKELELLTRELQVSLDSQKKAEEVLSQNAEKVKMDVAGFEQKSEFSSQNMERILREIDKLADEKQEVVANAKDSLFEINKKEEDIKKISLTIAHMTKEKEKATVKAAALQKKRESLSTNNKSFFAKQEELSKHINMLDKEAFRLNNQKEKLKESSENHMNYMWEEYELTPGSANELRDENLESLLFLKKNIATIKEEIRGLGDVNVNAIEAYKELLERHTFLKEQYNDLTKAEESLQKIIEELDEGMRKQFTEKFAEIQVEFDKAFKQLFGGGKGTLQLMDDDILEAGVTIISQPPGKKLQNMMQLSGGEKALTAIALLFAIQNLKPSPFCLLDEIEAALDDSNVTRYARYLHQLTKHTQFIIITHRRGTMAAADRLYGITMQEKGVSTLVSVNLMEEDLD